ncbi:MAG: ATP synthase F1 subunit delta [Patescibacteria group bacterium]
MKITSQQYASALLDAVHQTAEKDHNLVLDNFVKVLAQNGDLSKYQEIENEYKILEMQGKGITSAEVTLAREVEVNSVLMDSLNKVVSGKVEIRKKIDESIIGGVVLRVDDMLIDASVRGQLDKLNQTLKE